MIGGAHTLACGYQIILIVVHNRGKADVGNRAGVSMAGQRDNFRGFCLRGQEDNLSSFLDEDLVLTGHFDVRRYVGRRDGFRGGIAEWRVAYNLQIES